MRKINFDEWVKEKKEKYFAVRKKEERLGRWITGANRNG